jgi:hypothetical protein
MTEREDVEALVRETCRWRTDGNMVSWVEFEDVVDLAEGVRAAERERLAADLARAWEDGFNAHRNLVAQVSAWNASEGETAVVEPLNPYRIPTG